MEFVLKQLITLFVSVALIHDPTIAQIIEHGTYFTAGSTSRYAVVAIDSRQMRGGIIDDQYCKIQVLSSKAFFFARGTTSASDNNISLFDAREVARSVFVEFGAGTTRFAEMAAAWAARVKAIYDSRPDEFGRFAINGIMADGFFVGVDANGDITMEGQRISYQPFGLQKFVTIPQPKPNGPPVIPYLPTYVSGYFEIMNEFRNGGTTERARKISAEFGASQDEPDSIATRYSAYVKAVRDWAGDPGIGGDIATIILERESGIRWFHRPDFCPER
jgi:hypothetical protein